MTIQVPFHLRRRSSSRAGGGPAHSRRAIRACSWRCCASPGPRSAGPSLRRRGRLPAGAGAAGDRARCPARSACARWRRPSTSRSTPSWSRRCWTTRRVDWCATGAWSFRRAAVRCLFDRHAPVDLNELLSGRASAAPRLDARFPSPVRWRTGSWRSRSSGPIQPADELYRRFQAGDRGTESARAGSGRATSDKPGAAEGEGPGDQPSDEAGDRAHASGQSMPGQAGDGEVGRWGAWLTALRAMFAQAGHALVVLKDKAQWEWVDHSHLLRKLLREFRDGDPAKALRRAVPLMPPDEPVRSHASWPGCRGCEAIYNLGDLLRRRSAGTRRGECRAARRAEPDRRCWPQEYRKAAQRAAEQGDFRRAAYIHGFLLRDDRKAAGVLQRGGLHHDAAMLYLKKLNDLPAAAQAFEAAGEVDRAIELYRQIGRHEAAGDLLRRIGEEEAALAEYAAAAADLAGVFASRSSRRRPVVAAESPQARAGRRAVSARLGPAARGQRGALRARAGAASCRAGRLGADHRRCSTRPMHSSRSRVSRTMGSFTTR